MLQSLSQLQTCGFRHIHIEEHDVARIFLQLVYGLAHAGGFGNDLRLTQLVKQIFEFGTSGRFVVDDDRFQHDVLQTLPAKTTSGTYYKATEPHSAEKIRETNERKVSAKVAGVTGVTRAIGATGVAKVTARTTCFASLGAHKQGANRDRKALSA